MTDCKQLRVFNEDYLITLLARDGATLLTEPEKFYGGAQIHSRCSCTQEFTKLFRDISYYGGAFCKACIIKNKKKKAQETCKKLYGVTNVSQVEKFQKKKEETYLENWGMHPKKTKEIQEKYEATCLERYNVKNAAQASDTKQKIKDTFKENYGGHPMLDASVKEKVRTTCMDRYGGYPAENDTIKDKIKATCIERYGGYPTQNSNIQQTIRENNMDKYGCHPTQTIEVMEKIQHNSKTYKKFTMPSGEVRLVQGYEPFALRDLLKLYTEDEIRSERKDIPRFSYTVAKQSKYYFPDIFIPSTNTIIEIKSEYTYKKDKQKLDCVKGEIQRLGYHFEIWIYTRLGICQEKILES